jgi:outer membrane receptor protein involved in Fe transport
VDKCSAATGGPGWTYASRVFKQTPMGGFGRMPWTFDWGASVTWTIPVQEVDLKVRLSVNNLLNKQTTVRVRTRYEVTPGVYRETFGEGSNWTAPRSASLVLTYNF